MISLASLFVGLVAVGRLLIAAFLASLLARRYGLPVERGTHPTADFVLTVLVFFFLFSALVAAIHGGSR